MKTNAKKRMLVSSVAMLLVAMIALGTATFAWFTSSTTATASGISIHTAKSSTLEIAGNDLNNRDLKWGTSINYGVSTILRPVSADRALLTNNSVEDSGIPVEKWYEAVAANQTSFAAAAGKAKDTTVDKTVVKNQLNIRNAGSAAVNNVKVTVSGFNAPKYAYARIALVEANALDKDAIAKTGGTSLLAAKVDEDEEFKAATGLAPTTAEGVTGNDLTLADQTIDVQPDANGNLVFNVADSIPAAVKNGENITYTEKYFNLYIWFEGQDKDCYSNNPVDISGLTFEVTGTTVDQNN